MDLLGLGKPRGLHIEIAVVASGQIKRHAVVADRLALVVDFALAFLGVLAALDLFGFFQPRGADFIPAAIEVVDFDLGAAFDPAERCAFLAQFRQGLFGVRLAPDRQGLVHPWGGDVPRAIAGRWLHLDGIGFCLGGKIDRARFILSGALAVGNLGRIIGVGELVADRIGSAQIDEAPGNRKIAFRVKARSNGHGASPMFQAYSVARTSLIKTARSSVTFFMPNAWRLWK